MNEAQANPHTNNANADTTEQQQSQQLNVEQSNVSKLTPEQEEEAKLRIKYPNPQKPGGSAFIQKMLHRGSKKYFDSGDWNMAQSRQKSNLNSVNQSNRTMNTIAMNNATSITTTTIPTNISVTSPSVSRDPQANADLLQTPSSDRGITSSPLSTSSNLSPVVTASNENSSHLNTTPNAVSNIDPTIKVTTTPTMYSSNTCNSQNITPLANNNLNHPLNHHYLNTSNSVSPLMSSSISSNNLLNPHFNNQQQSHQQLSSSMSTQSISMLSSSISNDRLSTIQLNPTNPTCILDNEEIGHVIPTPECLPQSRKHSIVQSKLATPRLSSS